MPAKKNVPLLDEIVGQLSRELDEDPRAVAAGLRGEFAAGTVEVSGQDATDALQHKWATDPKWREAEIDRLGPEKWFATMLDHVATGASPEAKKQFMHDIAKGVPFADAMRYAAFIDRPPAEPAQVAAGPTPEPFPNPSAPAVAAPPGLPPVPLGTAPPLGAPPSGLPVSVIPTPASPAQGLPVVVARAQGIPVPNQAPPQGVL